MNDTKFINLLPARTPGANRFLRYRTVLFLFLFATAAMIDQAKAATPLSEGASRAGLQTPGFALDMGFHYYFQEDYNRALQYFEKYNELTGGDEVSYRTMAKIHLQTGNNSDAEKYLLKALEKDAKSEESLMLLGNLYLDMNRTEKATPVFERITQISPANEQALYTLAQIYLAKGETRQAIVYYKKLEVVAHSNGPQSYYYLIQAYHHLAEYYYELADYPRSLQYFQKIVQLNPSDVSAFYSLSELYRLNGKFRESVETLKPLLPNLNLKGTVIILESMIDSLFTLSSPDTRVYIGIYLNIAQKPAEIVQAMDLYYRNQLKEADNTFRKILSENPARISARIGLYQIYSKQNNRALAKRESFSVGLLAQKIGAFELATDYYNKVFALMEEESAEIDFHRSFGGDPIDVSEDKSRDAKALLLHAGDYIELYYNHGITLEKRGLPDQALAYYRRALEYNLRAQTWYAFLAKAQKEESYQEELAFSHDKEYELRLKIAWTGFNTPKAGEVNTEKQLKTCISINPDDPRAYYLAGLIEYSASDESARKHLPKAIGYFNSAIEKGEALSERGKAPGSYYFYRGVSYEKQGDFQAMENDLKTAISIDKYNPIFLNYLGYMYSLKNENLDDAFTYINRALEDEPDNAAYLDTLGWIYFQMGKYEEALAQLLIAKNHTDKKNKKDAVIFFHLAETYQKLNRDGMALLFYRQSLETIHTASETLDKVYIEKQIQVLSDAQ